MSQAHRAIAAALVAVCASAVATPARGAARARRVRAAHRARAHQPAAAAAAAAARPAAAATAAPVGHVQFVTDKRAYLDRGARDGLGAHQTIQIWRNGRVVATCTVEIAGDRQAACVGARLRPGDTFRLPGRGRADRAAAAQRPPDLPPVIDEGTLRARAAAVADTPYEKVEFTGKPAFRARSTSTVSPGFAVWQTQGDPNGQYTQERLDGAISVLDIGTTGMRFDGSFSAIHWLTPGAERFRPGAPSQFYLWQAETSRRRTGDGAVFAVGRLWPWHTPGLTVLDGFQLGRQNHDGTAEGGVYGGFVPSALALAPSIDVWAAGVYGSALQAGSKNTLFRLARQEARVGIWRGPVAGTVAEAEALAQVWVGPCTLGGGGRLRVAPEVASKPVVERATVDVGLRPARSLGGSVHLRYFGASLLDDAPLRAVTPTLAGAMHALADLHWEALSWVGVAAVAGAHREQESGRGLAHGAAEIRFPRLFGDAGGVWVGGEAEQGWLQGRGFYVQVVGRLAERVQVVARASASASEFQTPVAAPNLREYGGYLNVDGTVASWLRVRAWSMLRIPFLEQGDAPQPPTGGLTGVAFGSTLTGIF